jgi:hypothetical protein
VKKLIFLLALSATSHSIIFSQGCLPEGITFTTQEQIDNFQANYPGCTEIEGDVYISGIMSNLSGLSLLTAIEGKLVITYCNILTNINGLDSLVSVGEDLTISHMDTLQNLDGFKSLYSIGGMLRISFTEMLNDISGLSSLTHIGGIFLEKIPSLKSISCFHNIDSVNGLYLKSCSSLISLEGLNSIQSIETNLNIDFCDSLNNLSGLDSLHTIGGSFFLSDNALVSNLEGLNNLVMIHGMMGIIENESLIDLSALNSLDSVNGWLYISQNASLQTLSGLDNLAADSISKLYIFYNLSLNDCDVKSICDYLTNSIGDVYIFDNATGCNNQVEVEAACLTSIEENPTEEALTIFPNPASSFISINVTGGQAIEEAIIYNHLGQKALEAVPVNNMVDVSTLRPGIYFLEVITCKSRAGTKLVIE